MIYLILAIVVIYLIIGVVIVYVNREDKTAKFELTPQVIKSILLWILTVIDSSKKDKSL